MWSLLDMAEVELAVPLPRKWTAAEAAIAVQARRPWLGASLRSAAL